jgi:molybdate transport system regulatory protein
MPDHIPPRDVKLNYKIWLSTADDKGIMGDGKWQILKAIQEQGSLRAATKALGITYRRTWGDLKEIEEMLGISLLDKSRGGREGGQTQLTPEGVKLVQAFDQLHDQADAFMDRLFDDFRGKLGDILSA